MKKNILFTTAVLAGTSALAAFTNQVVVSATRIDTPIEQVGSSISVIGASDIKRQHAQNTQSALRLVPGIQGTQTGGPGTASSVYIRGANANHTMVLINGVRVNSNTSGGFNLSAFPSDAIERVEVLRGAQSALYGSDAIGGVVNIITKKGAPNPFGGSASIEIGEKGYRTGNLSLYGGNKTVDFNTSISFQGLEEYDISAHYGGGEDDPYRGLSFYTGLGLNFMDDGRADLTVLYNHTKNEIDTPAPWPGWWQVDDTNRITRTELLSTGLDLSKPMGERYTQRLKFGFNRMDSEGENDGIEEYHFTTLNADFSAQGDIKITESDTLNVGYDYRHSEAENSGKYDTTTRDQNAVFINNEWKAASVLFINLGGRYDAFSDIDGQATWRGTASWFALESTRFHGSAGTGYKAPTMNDLYWPTVTWPGGGSSGNPDLNPEQSIGFDAGIEETLLEGAVVADITYFQNTIEDMIVWDNPGTGFWAPTNLNEADLKGLETSLAIQPIESITTRIFYTYTDAKDSSTGNELARRAKHTGGGSINWQYSRKGNIYTDLTYTGKRYDNAANTRQLDDFILVGLGTRYALNESTAITAHVSNLFDEYYETAAGYGPVGRVISAGIELTF